jgi:hypothetical protein
VPVAGSSPTRCESQLLGDRGDRTSVPLSVKKDQRSSGNIKLRATAGQISAAGGENKKLIEQGQKGLTHMSCGPNSGRRRIKFVGRP